MRAVRRAVVAATILCAMSFFPCRRGYGSKNEGASEASFQVRIDESLLREARAAMDRGHAFLKKTQDPAGFWGMKEVPALTGLVVTSYFRDRKQPRGEHTPGYMRKALDFLVRNVREDGGIYAEGGMSNYNTSVCIMALAASGNPVYDGTIRRGRTFLWGHQATQGIHRGGFGYDRDSDRLYSDLSNTILALEALKVTEMLKQEGESADMVEKAAWQRAVEFVNRCQNLRSGNSGLAHYLPDDRGGFVYKPDESKAGATKTAEGKTALRSYGSMTYAGLLSYIYAEMDRHDERIQAAFAWLESHYTLDENPGMSTSGLYYYFHTMAKCLAASGVDYLEVKGAKIDWRHELLAKLVGTQKGDGSWSNSDNRWWEADPNLVTSYVLMAFEAVVESYPD